MKTIQMSKIKRLGLGTKKEMRPDDDAFSHVTIYTVQSMH